MTIADFQAELAAAGARPGHARRLLRAWLGGRPLTAGEDSSRPYPARLRAALPEFSAALDVLATVHSRHPGADGSERWLLALNDGQQIESVLLPPAGLCVSTQVGCAVGCVFCMTGQGGLVRQLTSLEMLAQVALARRTQAVNKVVFMGMGEPAHNLEATLEAITWLGTEGGIGHKNLVFSTVGDRRVFERLPLGPVKPALALSLHTTNPELRARLLPRAPRLAPEELVALGETYARVTTYPIQYQWTLLAGINDSDAELDRVAALLKGRYAVLNLIPYNTVEGLDFHRPSWERAAGMARYLHQRGVLTKLRHSAGQDIEGGCGQLRARAVAPQSKRPAKAKDDTGSRPLRFSRS